MTEAAVYDYGLLHAVNRFAEMVEDAVSGADHLRDQLDSVDDLARLLTVVRDAQTKLDLLAREVEADLADAMPNREAEVPGVGVLKRYARKRTEWDSSRLFATLANRACATDDPEAAVLELFDACLPIRPSTAWKVTGLRECGLDPDEYRATEHKGWRVQITEPDG